MSASTVAVAGPSTRSDPIEPQAQRVGEGRRRAPAAVMRCGLSMPPWIPERVLSKQAFRTGDPAFLGTLRAMLLTEIDHVAIAVNDLEAAIDYYQPTFGCEVDHREIVERDGVEEALPKVADSYVQLLTPSRDDSPVAKYLARRARGSTTSATASTTAPRHSTR